MHIIKAYKSIVHLQLELEVLHMPSKMKKAPTMLNEQRLFTLLLYKENQQIADTMMTAVRQYPW